MNNSCVIIYVNDWVHIKLCTQYILEKSYVYEVFKVQLIPYTFQKHFNINQGNVTCALPVEAY